MVVKWLYQEVFTFYSMFQNLHSVELTLESSRLNVNVALKNLAKFTGKHLHQISFSKKVAGSLEFSALFSGNFFEGHLRTITSEQSLFHDFSENIVLKATTTVNQEETNILKLFYLKIRSAYNFKTILNNASLIFALPVFFTNSLHSSKIDFILFNFPHKLLQNIQRLNCR